MTARVLVVDDEFQIQGLLREALSDAGFAVDTAGTAAEALRLVREQLYDAAILDFALPDMNGILLHHEIRRMDGDLADHTLFVSAHDQSPDDRSYFDSLGRGFLSKPFDVLEVIAALRLILEEDRNP
jgi:DNA-binding response OmpR family regulator